MCGRACDERRSALGIEVSNDGKLTMQKLFVLCSAAAVGWLGSAGFVPAQTPTNALPARPVTLPECFQQALQNNLDLQIERISPALSLADLDIARAGYDPVFTFSSQHSYSLSGGGLDANKLAIPSSRSDSDTFSSGFSGNGPIGMTYNLSGNVSESYGRSVAPFDTSSGSISLSLTQPLLKNFLFDTTRWNIAVAKNRLKYSELRLRFQIMNVLSAVEQAYYDLIFSRENVKVQEQALQLARQLFEDNKRRVEIGTMARLDEKQAESQVAAREADLTSARNSLATAQNNLKKLITANYRGLHDAPLDPTEVLTALPTSLDLQQSWDKGMSQRPDLLQSRLDLERQGLNVKYYKNQRLPEVDLTGRGGHGASGNAVREFSDAFGDFRKGDKPFYTVGASITVPLENKAARQRYKQSKLSADQLLLDLKKLEEGILVQIDESVNLVRSNFDRVESTRKARAYAEAALLAEQQKLGAGKSTSFVVLQLQRDLTSARSEEIRALADYNKALSQLHLNEGTTLERNKINVEVK